LADAPERERRALRCSTRPLAGVEGAALVSALLFLCADAFAGFTTPPRHEMVRSASFALLLSLSLTQGSTETETYPTHAGIRAVPVLEEVDMSSWAHLFTMGGEMREWKDRSGKHSIEASFVDYKGSTVQLTTNDRKLRKLKQNDLSEDDQNYVREQKQDRRRLIMAKQ
jgi:hypothetical protein